MKLQNSLCCKAIPFSWITQPWRNPQTPVGWWCELLCIHPRTQSTGVDALFSNDWKKWEMHKYNLRTVREHQTILLRGKGDRSFSRPNGPWLVPLSAGLGHWAHFVISPLAWSLSVSPQAHWFESNQLTSSLEVTVSKRPRASYFQDNQLVDWSQKLQQSGLSV